MVVCLNISPTIIAIVKLKDRYFAFQKESYSYMYLPTR